MPPEENAGSSTPISELPKFRLHHIGYLVKSIEQYLVASQWTKETDTIEDPLQNARLCLLRMQHPDDPLFELVEFLQPDEAQRTSRAPHPGLHHLCFAVPSTGAGEQWARSCRFLPVTPWKPAVLFGGLPVRFYYSRNHELLELLSETI